MPELVTLTHPKLPGREIQVRAAAVHHHQRGGWRVKSKSKRERPPAQDKPVEDTAVKDKTTE